MRYWRFCFPSYRWQTRLTHINNLQTPKIIAAVPVQTPINHCSVPNLTASNLSLSAAVSCSILVSVSLIFKSWLLASSLILPFSKFKSNLTLACVLCTSSRNLEFSFAKSFVNLSWLARVRLDSVLSADSSSERNFAKSTFCV